MKIAWLSPILLMATMTSALAANPEWDKATSLYNSGDYRAALSAFRKISDKNPSEPTAHYMLAQCYKNNGNTKQAIAELEWISNSGGDQRVKGPASALLAQIRAGGAGGGASSVGGGATGPNGLKPGVAAGLAPGTYSVMPSTAGRAMRYRQEMIPGAINPRLLPLPGTIMITPDGRRIDGTGNAVTGQPQR